MQIIIKSVRSAPLLVFMSVHPVCLSAKKVPRAVPWLAIEPTSLKRLQNHLMLIMKWNLRLRTEVPQQKFPILCPTHVLHLGRTPKALHFCTRKHTHTRVMASSQPATFITASLTSALSCQESSAPVTTSGSCCASVHIVVLHFPASLQSWLLLQALWTVLQDPMKCSSALMGILYRGLTEDAQWMHLCSNNGINSCIMIDVPLVSPGQGLGSFINYLSLVR